jgi:hypothetical protein
MGMIDQVISRIGGAFDLMGFASGRRRYLIASTVTATKMSAVMTPATSSR